MVCFVNSQTATIKGIILDNNNLPISNVNIKAGTTGTVTNDNGFYLLKIRSNQDVLVEFSHISHKKIESTFNLKNGETYEFNPVMSISVEQIATIVVTGKRQNDVEGITTLNPETIRKIPGANAGVENLLMTLPGVSNNNELSTQYAVRGGNYDENLVYVNDIEIYRPFLIRSGQQEGLSFVNTDLVQNVDFSAGGFQAKFGDKLSSVLDITYKNPYQFEAHADLSLLGGSVSVEGISKDSKLTGIVGLRYRDNSLLVNAKETETNYDPVFADVQTYLTYKFTDKFHLSFLGNASLNKYSYQPQSRQTNFGTLTDPLALVVYYEGQEKDQYQTLFGAFKGTYLANDNLTLHLITSGYHTTEEEYFDILAQYNLGQVNANIGDENLGEVEFSEGIGGQLSHGRNDLDALITNIEHKGSYNINSNQIEWSVKYTHEDIRDRLVEWEVIDSAGFSVNPPKLDFFNEQPYTPYEGPLVAYQNVRATNNAKINRLQAYTQWSKRSTMGTSDVWYNLGVRVHNWSVSGENIASSNQTVFSPRAQFAIKPYWQKDMLFRISGGMYNQPPFYKDLRGFNGSINTTVATQKSVQVVIGNDYSFNIWNRPFKLISEVYFKDLTNVNTYTVDNVKLRYRADNNAEAYATGVDLRLNGEFVPGTESWVSIGFLKTEENYNNQGYIARPTDQRFKFGMLFQDYVPNLPNLKAYLNLVYNSGLPGGSPAYADVYQFQQRLRDYRRADLGISYIFTDANNTQNPSANGVTGWLEGYEVMDFSTEYKLLKNYNIKAGINNLTNQMYATRRAGGYPGPGILPGEGRTFFVSVGAKF